MLQLANFREFIKALSAAYSKSNEYIAIALYFGSITIVCILESNLMNNSRGQRLVYHCHLSLQINFRIGN